ncbi:MAG TPA: hypothetical protein DCP28_20755, partial [Cytophagales bacterium]|nr:hypothetical protein [Cytophagales bacterium]
MKPWEEDETFLGRWLNGDVSEAEKAEFEGSEEGKSYKALVMAADTLRAPQYDADAELSKLQARLQEAPAAKVVPLYRRPVVQLLVAASVVLLVMFTFLRPRGTTVTTAFGEQELVTLPDGSQVRMHANS